MASKPDIIRSATMSKHIFMGIFGDPGIGKSRLTGTSPGNVLIIRPAQQHLDSLLPADKARVEEAIVEDWSDMDDLQTYLRADGAKYDWVWINNLSILQDVLLDDIWAGVIHRKPERATYGPDKSEYGINMDRIGRWLRHTVGPDLFNLGFTAHPSVLPSPDLDAEGEPVEKLMPWVQGKNMSPKVCSYMNVVAFMEKAKIGQKVQRVLRTEASEAYYAKDKFDAFGGRVVDPTMPKVVSLIEKSPGRTAVEKTNQRKAGRPARRRVTKRR